jgi:hypothetical protein
VRPLDSDEANRRLLIAEYLNDTKKRMPYPAEREKVNMLYAAWSMCSGPVNLALTNEKRYVSYLTSLRNQGVLI